MEDKVLQIKQSRVLAAAEKCPDWKAGLKEMFPDAFENEPIGLRCGGRILTNQGRLLAFVWEKEICLDSRFDWKITEETGSGCAKLIPTRKS